MILSLRGILNPWALSLFLPLVPRLRAAVPCGDEALQRGGFAQDAPRGDVLPQFALAGGLDELRAELREPSCKPDIHNNLLPVLLERAIENLSARRVSL